MGKVNRTASGSSGNSANSQKTHDYAGRRNRASFTTRAGVVIEPNTHRLRSLRSAKKMDYNVNAIFRAIDRDAAIANNRAKIDRALKRSKKATKKATNLTPAQKTTRKQAISLAKTEKRAAIRRHEARQLALKTIWDPETHTIIPDMYKEDYPTVLMDEILSCIYNPESPKSSKLPIIKTTKKCDTKSPAKKGSGVKKPASKPKKSKKSIPVPVPESSSDSSSSDEA